VAKKTGYAPVNGRKMYYEVRGEGKPAVFIHPVVNHSGLIPELPKNRQWILMDLQGHGRTTVAAFLDAPTPKVPIGTHNGYYPGVTR
jgi:pimeloyl-ACP methyl ester carboxylesterase